MYNCYIYIYIQITIESNSNCYKLITNTIENVRQCSSVTSISEKGERTDIINQTKKRLLTLINFLKLTPLEKLLLESIEQSQFQQGIIPKLLHVIFDETEFVDKGSSLLSVNFPGNRVDYPLKSSTVQTAERSVTRENGRRSTPST